MKRSILLTIVLVPSLLLSQEVYNLEKCRSKAKENNLTIQVKEKMVESASAKKEAVRKEYYPNIDAYGNYKFLQEPLQLSINDQKFTGNNNQYQVGLNVIQPIYMGGAIKAKNTITEFNKQASIDIKELSVQQVLFLTEMKYWNCIYMKMSVKNITELKKLVDELVLNVKDKIKNNVVSRNDLLMAEVKQNEAELEKLKAQNRYKISLMELNKVMGVDINANIDVDEKQLYSEKKVPSLTDIEAVTTNRAEWKVQQSKVSINETELKLVKAKYRPNLVLGVVPYWGDPNTDLLGDGPMYNTAIMANLSLKVFDWGKRKHLLNEKKVEFEAAKIESNELKQKIHFEVNSAFFMLQEAIAQIQLTEQSVLKTSENLKLINERYLSGLSLIIELLEAQGQWIKSYNEEVKAKVEYFQALAIYKRSIGEI